MSRFALFDLILIGSRFDKKHLRIKELIKQTRKERGLVSKNDYF